MNENEINMLAYAKSGNIDGLKKLIKEGVDVNICDKDDISVLHEAMEWLPHLKNKDFIGLAKLLIEAGADPNKQDKWGATPLYLAAKEGFIEIVKYMHDKGAKMDIAFKNGWTHLHEIGKKMGGGFTNISLTITENGKEKTITDNDEIRKIQGNTLQDEFTNYVLTAKYLIENGADVNKQTNNDKQTPLMHASDNGSYEMVKLLMEKGVKNINHQDKHGYTALHYASKKGYLDIVIKLVENGASPTIQELYGFTPLHEAAENDKVNVIEYLLANGADNTIGLTKSFSKYLIGDTPLDIAKKAKRKKATEYLKNI